MDSTSNVSRSGPPIRNQSSRSHSISGTGSSDSIEGVLPQARKRRGPNSVTSNACTNCKKAKAKCDGVRPTCHRCRARGQSDECHYEMHTKMQKEDMIREIRELREKNNWVERILRAIRTDDKGPEIIQRLRSGQSYETISQFMNRPPFADFPQLSPHTQVILTKAIAEYELDLQGERNGGNLLPGSQWTDVTADEELIDHLMALYFTWIHPVHMVFSENHFLASYKNRSDLYCTTSLVNAICAMGCHLFDVNPEDSGKWREIDSLQLREQFMDEARNKLPHDDQPKMTTIQTLTIMFLVDLGSGQASKASHYIRTAGEMLNIRLQHHYSTESMEITRWGIYSLNVAWSSVSFQLPTVVAPKVPRSDVFKDVLIDTHDSLWRFYRYAGQPGVSEHPSSAIIVAQENAKLMLMVHKTADMLYDRRDNLLSASEVIEQYKEYLDWEKELPQEMSLPHGMPNMDELDQLTPHVLSLCILYHTAHIQLLQPCLGLTDIETRVRNQLISITVSHARKSYESLQLYRELFSLRYHPTLQNFYLLQACDILVRYSPTQPPAQSVVRNCLQFLKEAADGRGGFPVCGPLQGMFKRTAIECQIPLPDDLDDLMGSKTYYTTQNLLDASTRLTYRQPLERVMANMDSTISQDLGREWPESDSDKPVEATRVRSNTNTSTRKIRIDELLNDAGDPMEL